MVVVVGIVVIIFGILVGVWMLWVLFFGKMVFEIFFMFLFVFLFIVVGFILIVIFGKYSFIG